MVILALDTSTPAGSVALVEAERVVAARYFDAGAQHGQRLFAEIDQVLKAAEVPIKAIQAVAASEGPGSFTGLRIGLSAAKGLCLAGDKPLVLVPTLEALAARLPFARFPVCGVLDARKGEVYAALYDTSTGTPRLLEPPRAITPARLLAERLGQATIYAGDGVAAHRARFAAHPGVLLAGFGWARPEAITIAWLALARLRAGQTVDPESAEPRYLRAADAQVRPRLLQEP
jgi:tRNA threonylcarbamoyladenosine biosynthesis protein TsaB